MTKTMTSTGHRSESLSSQPARHDVTWHDGYLFQSILDPSNAWMGEHAAFTGEWMHRMSGDEKLAINDCFYWWGMEGSLRWQDQLYLNDDDDDDGGGGDDDDDDGGDDDDDGGGDDDDD